MVSFTDSDVDFSSKLAGSMIEHAISNSKMKFKVTAPKTYAAEQVSIDAVVPLCGSKWWVSTEFFEGEMTFERLLVLTLLVGSLKQQWYEVREATLKSNRPVEFKPTMNIPMSIRNEDALEILSKLEFQPTK